VKGSHYDVYVRFESGESLARGAAEKIAKLADFFVSQGTAREAQVLPIVVDSRRAIPKDTLKALNILWLDGRRLELFLAKCGVGSSVQVTCMHLNYTYPSRFDPTCFEAGERVAH
jgi:hypothetical protein